MLSTAARRSTTGVPPTSNIVDHNAHDAIMRVIDPSDQDAEGLQELYNTLSSDGNASHCKNDSSVHKEFSEFLENEKHVRPLRRLAVRFQNVTTWGSGGGPSSVKTLKDAIVGTAVLGGLYQWTVKPWIRKPSNTDARPLIRNVSGCVKDGEMML
jgi:hypothetical protein